MNQEKWRLVKGNFEGTEDLTDGYYRLRPIEEGYEFAYLVAGPCGDKIPHPAIKLREEGNYIQPIALRDLEVSPILNLTTAAGDQEQIEQQADQLLNRFIKIKKLSI